MPFARAVLDQDKKQTRLAVLCDNGQEVGLMAVHELKIGPVHLVHLYRGPLWFADNPSDDLLRGFAFAFNQAFPPRLLRFRRWLPEWPDSAVAKGILEQCGFKSRAVSYETQILDLRPSENEILRLMRGNWRNQMRRAENLGVSVTFDHKGTSAKLFLHRYKEDRLRKKYYGRSVAFLRTEMSLALAYDEMFLVWAVHERKTVAAILVLVHGRTASYRIGWTTPEGRHCYAHNLLLWSAVKELKKRGVSFFDLAGVEPGGDGGLSHFKRGLGGFDYKTLGVYG